MPTSTTIQIPKNAPITQTDGKVSREWARYFDLLTPQASSAASGVTSVTGTPPIASSGGTTPAISLNDTAVTPATYGDATHVGQFTIDQQGRLTFAANIAITYPAVATDYVLMSDGSTPPNAMNNGGSSFLYIGYTP